MNQDNNQTTALLVKVILAVQILMLILFACSYFANSSLRAEYKNQIKQYREEEAQYEKEEAQYQKGIEDYQRQMADYKLQLAAWEKANAGYTNTNSAAQTPQ
jgi:hypothetical protein